MLFVIFFIVIHTKTLFLGLFIGDNKHHADEFAIFVITSSTKSMQAQH